MRQLGINLTGISQITLFDYFGLKPGLETSCKSDPFNR